MESRLADHKLQGFLDQVTVLRKRCPQLAGPDFLLVQVRAEEVVLIDLVLKPRVPLQEVQVREHVVLQVFVLAVEVEPEFKGLDRFQVAEVVRTHVLAYFVGTPVEVLRLLLGHSCRQLDVSRLRQFLLDLALKLEDPLLLVGWPSDVQVYLLNLRREVRLEL